MPAIVHHVDMKTDSTGNTAGYKNAAGEQIMLVSGKTNALTGGLEIVGIPLPYGSEASVFDKTGERVLPDPAATGRIYTDVLIYGANIGGCFAAIALRKRGFHVVMIHPDDHLGGMTTGGLSAVDIKSTDQMKYNTLYEDYTTRCAAKYGLTRDQLWSMYAYCVEPKVADAVLRAMLSEAGVMLIVNRYPYKVMKTGAVWDRAVFSHMDGVSLPITVYMSAWADDSDELDLAAIGGATVFVGREATTDYTEALAGITVGQAVAGADISAYKTPGVSGSGLLHEYILAAAPGATGATSSASQAYNYRVICAQTNKIPFPDPAEYNPLWYEPIGRLLVLKGITSLTVAQAFLSVPLPNGKYDWNNYDSTTFLGTDALGFNAGYITANWATRKTIIQKHKDYWLGLIKWFKTDPRVPAEFKAELAGWGLCADEFMDNGGFSPRLYVRTGRRLRGVYVHTQADVMSTETPKHGIGFANYGADSHACTLYADGSGILKKEGWFYQNPPNRHTIKYGSLCPVAGESTNGLAIFGLSATAVGIASIRMEPQRACIGEAAGHAIAIALEDGLPVQNVPLPKLQGRIGLTHGGIILSVDCPAENGTVDIQPSAASWTKASAMSGGTAVDFYGKFYYTSGGTGGNSAAKYCRFKPNVGTTGPFKVYIKFPRNPAGDYRATNVKVDVVHAGGTAALTVDTRSVAEWYDAGTYTFNTGTPSAHYVDIKTSTSDGNVILSAVEFVPA